MDVGPELMMANRLDGTNICLQWPVSKRAGRDITKQVGREKLPSAEYIYTNNGKEKEKKITDLKKLKWAKLFPGRAAHKYETI